MKESEVFYQVKLILETLTPEEYDKIPKKTLEVIEKRAKKSDNIAINLLEPLENQNIDIKVVEVLNEVLNSIPDDEKEYVIERKNDESSITIENLKKTIKQIEEKNRYLNKELEMLRSQLNQVPKFIRKIFIKDTRHLLSDKH